MPILKALPLVQAGGAAEIRIDFAITTPQFAGWTAVNPTRNQELDLLNKYAERVSIVRNGVRQVFTAGAGANDILIDGGNNVVWTSTNPTTQQMVNLLNAYSLALYQRSGKPVAIRVDNDNFTFDAGFNQVVGATGAGVNNGIFWQNAMNSLIGALPCSDTDGYKILDYCHNENEERFRGYLNRSVNNDSLDGLNDIEIECFEPLICPPFNPFLWNLKNLPDSSFFKKMSPMIPNVSHMELTYCFQNLSQSALFPRYLRANAVSAGTNKLEISDLAADLYLWWYRPLEDFSKMELTLQSWDVEEYASTLNNNNNVNNNSTLLSVESQLIPNFSVPTLYVIHAEVNKSSDSYSSNAINSDLNQKGLEHHQSLDSNALDSYMEISNLQVVLGDRPQVINTNFTQQELYNLTVQNSNYMDFPYSFDRWRGSPSIAPHSQSQRFNQMSKCFVAITSKDLSEQLGEGVVIGSQQVQFTMDLTARDGFHNLAGGNKKYELYVHVYRGNQILEMVTDKAKFQQDIINMKSVV